MQSGSDSFSALNQFLVRSKALENMIVGQHHSRSTRPIDLSALNSDNNVSVHQLPRRLHADLQPDLHDAPHRPLVGLPPVPGAHAAGTWTVRRFGPVYRDKVHFILVEF